MSHATKCFVLVVLTLSIAAADSLTVVNPNFANVEVQCSGGYAYQSTGGNCEGPNVPQQDFNTALGMGWTFASFAPQFFGPGMVAANSEYGTPSFAGFPFSEAALLQGSGTAVGQTMTGFVPGGLYTLNIYLGTRPTSAPNENGNQTVVATIDGRVIGTWKLVSFTPFTLQTAAFTVTSGGSHILTIAGLSSGDHTAFFSGVSMETATSLTVRPSAGVAGIGLLAAAGGFTAFETVNLIAYASAPMAIGTTTADADGVANVTGHIPQTPFGTLGLQAVGQTSGMVASGTIQVHPRVSVSPNTGGQGTLVTAAGFGFAARENVIVIWPNPQTILGSATANKSGTISGQFAIPFGAPPGTSEVLARGQKTGALAGAQITVQ